MFARARFALLILACALSLEAHAILLSAVPGPKEVVKGPATRVQLRFNSRIDAKRSRITLVAPDGTQAALAIEEQKSPDTLSSEAKALKSGSYILRWQVLASDGHITRGEVPFQVR